MTSLMRFLSGLLFVAFIGSTASCAEQIQSGRDYTVIDKPLAAPKDKIEVIEFFSYGCPHCNDFHPALDAWAAKLPSDVTLRRIPVSFNRPPWARLSRLYFALEAMGELSRLNGAVFKALHEDHINFNSDEAIIDWAVKNGIDGKKFGAMLNSFSIQSMVPRADQDAAAAGIRGVPSLVVDGKYLLNNEATTSFGGLLANADKLIAKVRTDRKKKTN
jgi:thiol:disulfide interchange protein DsbA